MVQLQYEGQQAETQKEPVFQFKFKGRGKKSKHEGSQAGEIPSKLGEGQLFVLPTPFSQLDETHPHRNTQNSV